MPATRTLTPLPPGGVCHARSARRDRLQRLMKELKEPFRVHRKQWEYAIVVEALEAADLIGPGKRGLGFGVGVEPLVAYFASRGCEIVATDLEHGWYENSFARLNERRICPPDRFARLVTTRHVDMNWMRVMVGLLKPTSGDVFAHGQPLCDRFHCAISSRRGVPPCL